MFVGPDDQRPLYEHRGEWDLMTNVHFMNIEVSGT